MKEQRIDEITAIMHTALQALYDGLKAAKCTDHEYTTAYVNVMAIALETIAMNTSDHTAMSLAIEVIKKFAHGKDGIALMVETSQRPAKEKMS